MEQSKRKFTHVLEIVTTDDHYFRFGYRDPKKAITAVQGFHTAMKEAPPDAVASIWGTEEFFDDGGHVKVKVPVFSVRCGKIGSVALKDYDPFRESRPGGLDWDPDDTDPEESWK